MSSSRVRLSFSAGNGRTARRTSLPACSCQSAAISVSAVKRCCRSALVMLAAALLQVYPIYLSPSLRASLSCGCRQKARDALAQHSSDPRVCSQAAACFLVRSQPRDLSQLALITACCRASLNYSSNISTGSVISHRDRRPLCYANVVRVNDGAIRSTDVCTKSRQQSLLICQF